MAEKYDVTEWLIKYAEAFGENYPIMMYPVISDKELCEILKKAIETRTPIKEPDIKPERVY